MDKLLIAYLVTTLNMTDDQVAALVYKKADDGTTDVLKDDALDILKGKDVERVKLIEKAAITGDKGTELFNNGHKKGLKEGAEKLEKHIKETYKIESDAEGVELIDFAVNTIKTAASSTQLDEDKVKIHPAYLLLEKKRKDDLAAAKKEREDELEKITKEAKTKETMQIVRKKAAEKFDSLGPVIAGTPEHVAKQKELFIEAALSGLEFTIEGEDIIPMKDGKRIEDDHKNSVSFEQLVSTKVSQTYELKKQDPKGNAGNEDDPAKKGANDTVVIKDEADFNKRMSEAKTTKEQATIYKSWQAQQGKS